MTYAVEFKKSAAKELTKLPKQVQVRLLAAINNLSIQPRKGNVRPMVGSTAWRLRAGEYRVIYDINDGKVVILILKVAARKNIYRKQ